MGLTFWQNESECFVEIDTLRHKYLTKVMFFRNFVGPRQNLKITYRNTHDYEDQLRHAT